MSDISMAGTPDPTAGVNDGIEALKSENEALQAKLAEQQSMIDQIKQAQSGADAKVAELLKEKKILQQEAMTSEQKLISTVDELKDMVGAVQKERDQETVRRIKLEALTDAGLSATYANLVPDDDIDGGVASLKALIDGEKQKASEELEQKLGRTPQTPGEVTEADLDRFRDDLAFRTKIYRESPERYRSLMKAIKE